MDEVPEIAEHLLQGQLGTIGIDHCANDFSSGPVVSNRPGSIVRVTSGTLWRQVRSLIFDRHSAWSVRVGTKHEMAVENDRFNFNKPLHLCSNDEVSGVKWPRSGNRAVMPCPLNKAKEGIRRSGETVFPQPKKLPQSRARISVR